jgi:hypothetical protein
MGRKKEKKKKRESEERDNPPHFLLTPAGAALLDSFIAENKRYKSQRSRELSDEIDPDELRRRYLSDNEEPGFIPLRIPSAQSLLEEEVTHHLAHFRPELAPSAWHQAYDALFEYYRLSPKELAHQYINHRTSGTSMAENAITRLKHESGPVECHLMENNLPQTHNDPVLQGIQARLSVELPNGPNNRK